METQELEQYNHNIIVSYKQLENDVVVFFSSILISCF